MNVKPGHRMFVVLVALAVAISASAIPPPNRDDPPGGGGAGGSCNYCTQTACGCSSPPVGYRLDYTCTCSSLQCTRSCTYSPL